MRSGLVALATAWSVGCVPARTEIVVVVDTDVPRGEMDGYRVLVFAQEDLVLRLEEEALLDRPFPIRDEPPASEDEPDFRLPASFGVAPRGGDADREVGIVLQGTLTDLTGPANERGVIGLQTTAVIGFVDGEKRRLDMVLAAACIGVTCEAGETCGAGDCAPEQVDATTLPAWPEK